MSQFAHRYEPGSDARTVLVLHGTGGDENSLVPFAKSLLPEAGILSPRGRILENGAPRFFRRFAEGVFDYDNIREEATALGDFIEWAAAAYEFDLGKLTAVGYSNGANIGWSTMLLRPSTLAEAVLFRPMVTLSDVEADLVGKRIFVSAGTRDPIVPSENSSRLARQMEALGADVTLHWHEGGHNLARNELELAAQWLRAPIAGRAGS